MTTLKCVCSKPVSKGYCMQLDIQLLNETFPETINHSVTANDVPDAWPQPLNNLILTIQIWYIAPLS